MKIEYKIEMLRVSKNRIYAYKDAEKFINEYAKNGWTLCKLNYDVQLFAYEIVFSRPVKE